MEFIIFLSLAFCFFIATVHYKKDALLFFVSLMSALVFSVCAIGFLINLIGEMMWWIMKIFDRGMKLVIFSIPVSLIIYLMTGIYESIYICVAFIIIDVFDKGIIKQLQQKNKRR